MNDNFTEAARAEGQARIAAMLEAAGASDDIRAWFPAGFEKGAEWARTRLAAQGPQVTIRHEEGEPSTCEVRQGGVLIFSGRDHSADLRVARAARRYEVTR